MHLICDNYATHKTPAIKRWLVRHPRFHLHFVPTSSLAQPRRTLVRRAHQPQAAAAARTAASPNSKPTSSAWTEAWNDNPRPYVWTKTADQILESIANYLQLINDSGH